MFPLLVAFLKTALLLGLGVGSRARAQCRLGKHSAAELYHQPLPVCLWMPFLTNVIQRKLLLIPNYLDRVLAIFLLVSNSFICYEIRDAKLQWHLLKRVHNL